MAQSEVLERNLVEQAVAFLGDIARDMSPLALWHCFKFLEIAIRQNAVPHKPRIEVLVLFGVHEFAVEVIKSCSVASANSQRHVLTQAIRLLELIAAIDEHTLALLPHSPRTTTRPDIYGVCCVTFDLSSLSFVEANRIPLTRLGASRAVKVVYNSPTATSMLQVLCERAIAAVEGT